MNPLPPRPLAPGGGAVASERARALVGILDRLRAGTPLSRPELVRTTGLGRAVVHERVAELLRIGLVDEPHRGPSAGGRAPRMVRFRAEAGHLLAADVGATSLAVAATDLAARVIAFHEQPIDVASGPDVVCSEIEARFAQLSEELEGRFGPLWGIGAGVPGPVDVQAGRPVAPPVMPGWDDYPVADRLSARHGVPAWLDNDVNLMALGELTAGGAHGHDTYVFVKVGTGIGAGIVSGGRLHRGAVGAAGDVGHIVVGNGVRCRCGKDGCLEALAGGAALARDGLAAARDGRSPVLAAALTARGSMEAADVGAAAAHGDPVSRELVENAGRLIGLMLVHVVDMLNPSLVVIGGGVANAGDLLLASIRETVYGHALPLATRHLQIQRARLGARCGVTGAAALAAGELFAIDRVSRWPGVPVHRPRRLTTSVD
jgi:glucokinase-like ROK family protein